MRKRERENPCGVCGHYHKYEEGEVCGICGHRMALNTERPIHHSSAFPSEIIPEFLYLGSYDNASRSELLKTQGISCILNKLLFPKSFKLAFSKGDKIEDSALLYEGVTVWFSTLGWNVSNILIAGALHLDGEFMGGERTVPACQNLYKNSFTYHCLQDDKILEFDDAIQFLEKCERDKARVLVHCMSGKNRSPAIVIAFLMKSKGWKLAQSFQWVKDRRPEVELSSAVHQQLQEFEQKIFGSTEARPNVLFQSPNNSPPTFGFGLTRNANPTTPFPVFNQMSGTSIFDKACPTVGPQQFVFGAGCTDSPMDGS
ncbi:Protein-tyrosine-phosphatase IBR5 [Acorus gramineus]|uniref:Protein-tyrosine-phosphatase IBR5 n=1 Tax=Acorus gramineus TaxID=55184 RepID=A0AAV9B9X8_ACOGR|nr:Protein-tyrosine-phosphatase IBR5 [Acorus gramineus]